jgi:hypothetical protein
MKSQTPSQGGQDGDAKQVSLAVTPWTCIRKVLGRNTGYYEGFRGFPQSLQGNAGAYYLG